MIQKHNAGVRNFVSGKFHITAKCNSVLFSFYSFWGDGSKFCFTLERNFILMGGGEGGSGNGGRSQNS